MSKNDEVDLFDLDSAAPAAPESMPLNLRPIETETNMYSIEFYNKPAPPATSLKIERPPQAQPAAAKPANAADNKPEKGIDLGLDGDFDDFDDDFPEKKVGFFARLFKKKDADIDLDNDFDAPDLDDGFGFDDLDLGDIPKPAKAPVPPPAIDTGVFEVAAAPKPAAVVSAVPAPSVPAAPAPAPIQVAAQPAAPAPLPPAPQPQPLPPPPVFTRIAHVCLYVRDLEVSAAFYANIGFKKRFTFNKKGKRFGAYLEFGSGGNFIELFEEPMRAGTAGSIAHFCLETPDIDGAMRSLSARGIAYTPKKLGCDSTYQIWLKDPDGNSFELHQYTPGSSQIVGKDVEADW